MARWALVTALALGATSLARAAVVGKINQIGFPGALEESLGREGGLLLRHGKWAPVSVDLRVEGADHFTGFLSVTQKDNDGDVVSSQTPVTLTAGAERSRTVWLYFLPRVDSRHEVDVSVRLVEVTDDDEERAMQIVTPEGAAVDRLKPARELLHVDDEHSIILDISARRVDAIHRLTRRVDDKQRFRRPLDTARVDARALPDAWYGLEMIDYIVWDGADPSVFDGSQRQLTAIIEWVHNGGCLLVASEQRWGELAGSALGPYLPVTSGKIARRDEPYPGLKALTERPNPKSWPKQTVTYCLIKPKAGAHAMAVDKAGESIIYERQVGHGRIVAVGTELRNLLNSRRLPAGIEPDEVLADLLRLRKEVETEEQYTTHDLFPMVRGFVDFQATAGIRLAIAILFVIAYILLATFGSWEWLRRRDWLKHSWTTFAAVAIGASVVSIGGVGWVQGIRTRVQQLSIIDTEANTGTARAHVLFGLKTPTHTNLDIWLPRDWVGIDVPTEESCWLRPIPGAAEGIETGYAAPGRYQIRPSRAALYGVPIRATLKQLAGHWTGTLPGQIRASIRTTTARRSVTFTDGTNWVGQVVEITPDSWILNDLKVDLVDSFLLHSMKVWPGEEARIEPRRDQDIYVRRLGPIEAGERLDDLPTRLYNDAAGKPISPHNRSGGPTVARVPPYSLMSAHKAWGARGSLGSFGGESDFSGQDSCDEGIMALTTLGEFIGEYPAKNSSGVDHRNPMRGGHARPLDRSTLLTPDTAMFIGFAEDAGPARLMIRTAGADDDAWRAVHPSASPSTRRTVYRVTIPINRGTTAVSQVSESRP